MKVRFYTCAMVAVRPDPEVGARLKQVACLFSGPDEQSVRALAALELARRCPAEEGWADGLVLVTPVPDELIDEMISSRTTEGAP